MRLPGIYFFTDLQREDAHNERVVKVSDIIIEALLVEFRQRLDDKQRLSKLIKLLRMARHL